MSPDNADFDLGKGVDNKDQSASIQGGEPAKSYTQLLPLLTAFHSHCRRPLHPRHRPSLWHPGCSSHRSLRKEVAAMVSISPGGLILRNVNCFRLDGMMDADEAYFKEHNEPLFSSHMIDLSEEEVAWNIETTAKYLKRAAPMKQFLEMEIGMLHRNHFAHC
jgi:hypothetical protein